VPIAVADVISIVKVESTFVLLILQHPVDLVGLPVLRRDHMRKAGR